MKILVTGGCGFIGSNFINFLLNSGEVQKDISILNVDKQTYAGQGNNLEFLGINKDPRYQFIKEDICNFKSIKKIFETFRPDYVFNFAAESHVDRSIENSSEFIQSNVVGTSVLLEISRLVPPKKFVQISTDEVYGSLSFSDSSSKETDILNPRSPYSATKAAADHLALAYFYTHSLPVIITRSSNNFGPFQFPEKLIPLFITNLIQNKKVPLMWSEENPGLNKRDWIYVEDNCRAIWMVSQKGRLGEIYNIPGKNEKSNMEITKEILKFMNFGEEMIEFVPHRKGHDLRYSLNSNKLKSTGVQLQEGTFEENLKKTIKWYIENKDWWNSLIP